MMVTSVTKADPPFLRPRLHSGESGVSFQAHVVQCERAAPVWRFRSPHQFLQRGGAGKRFSPKKIIDFRSLSVPHTSPFVNNKKTEFFPRRAMSPPFSFHPSPTART